MLQPSLLRQLKTVFLPLNILILLLFTLTACTSPLAFRSKTDDLSGALLVWHSWPEPESQIIHSLLDDFMRIHPRVTIVNEYVPSDQLDERFISQMAAGLGPDLIIGTEILFINELVKEKLLFDLSGSREIANVLLPQTVQALIVDERLYAIPFAAYTNVLFYNRTLVDQPAATMDELLDEMRAEVPVAIPTDFYNAYWGLRAFDGDIIDADGEIVIGDEVADWLQWLLDAQDNGAFLSASYEELRHFFADGNAAYLVGHSSDLPRLQEHLGADNVGIAMLPHRTIEGAAEELDDSSAGKPMLNQVSPGAFLELEVMAISQISAQKALAVDVIAFFINQQHQRELAQADFGQIPLNQKVRLDPRFSPNESTLIRQSTTGSIIPLSQVEMEETLISVGTAVFNQVLEGVLPPSEAMALIRQDFEQKLELDVDESQAMVDPKSR